MTPGQAEYEVFRAAIPDWVCNVPGGPWEDLSEPLRAGFAAIAAAPCPGCDSLRRQCSELAGEVGGLAGALTDIRDANPDAPAGRYCTERARITLNALHGSELMEAGTVPLARHAEYIKANQQLALSLHEATEPLLHGTADEQKLGRELRERHGLEP